MLVTKRLDDFCASVLKLAMGTLYRLGEALPPQGCLCASITPDVAMLVQPLEAAPYVFVPPNTVHVFDDAVYSSMDSVRRSIRAREFYEDLVARACGVPPDAISESWKVSS